MMNPRQNRKSQTSLDRKVEARVESETLWLTQQQMAKLFQTSRTNVVEHIQHIYDEGELVEVATYREFRPVRKTQSN